MKEYDWYLFDVDGTLIDTTELIYQCFVYSCKRFADLNIDRSRVVQYIGLPLRKQFEVYLGPLSNERAAEIAAGHMEYQLSIYPHYLKLFPHVKETLEILADKNKPCAVVTSRMPQTLNIYLKELGIFDYFTVLITPEDTPEHKPGPQPALKALARLNGKKEQAIMVGDSIFDIQCGQAAGVDTALVIREESHLGLPMVKPTYIIKEVREIVCA